MLLIFVYWYKIDPHLRKPNTKNEKQHSTNKP